MAGKLFIGMDLRKDTQALLSNFSATSAASDWANTIILPKGVYHNMGAPTSDYAGFAPPSAPIGSTYGIYDAGTPSGTGSYGASGLAFAAKSYTAATGTTRATWATAQGHQLGIVRSETGLLGDLYVTFDIRGAWLASNSIASSYEPSTAWARIFRFGDVEIAMKEIIFSSPNYTFVFTVRNNGAEIATVTVPGITTITDWFFCQLHVKLDATAGVIAFSVNGVNQSVAFASGNTVNTTSLAAATIVYIGPPVLDNGTIAYPGLIDNIYFDDTAFPAGRPQVAAFVLLGDDTLTDFAAVGTSPTTVVNALSLPTDAKAARATGANGSAVLTQTPPSTTSYMTDLVGIEMFAKNASNRNANGDRRVQLGYSISGVETMGLISKATPLPLRSTDPPPATLTGAAWPLEQIFETGAAVKLTKTQLATMKVVIKSVAP